MKKMVLPKYKGRQSAAASNVLFDVLVNLDDVMGLIVIAERPEPLTRNELDEYRTEVFQQTFADSNAQSEEQTN